MLLGNYNIFNANPGREFGGVTNAVRQFKAGSIYQYYTPNAATNTEQTKALELAKSAFHNSYRPPYSWLLSPKPGGIGSVNIINCTAEINAANLAGGLSAAAALGGTASLSATLQLIVSAIADITAGGSLAATIIGIAPLAASLSGSASLVGALQSLGNLVAAITADANLTGTITAIGHMEAAITSDTELSPASLAAAVWNAVAANFNTAGTMGEQENLVDTINEMIDAMHKVQGLSLTFPVTVTPTDVDVDTIHVDITGDGVTTSTMTRTT